MKTIKHLIIILTGLFVLSACQKEYSLETGSLGGRAIGTLKDSLGDCQPITLRGLYFADSTLTDSNYVDIQVNITTPGSYTIFTDTQNGYSFKDSGYFAITGLITVRLKATGRPILPITSDFTVTFGSTFCLFTVPVLPKTTAPPAVYTLSGSPTNCTNAVVQGTYTTGTALNSSNRVSIEVNVTTPGSYAISTTQTNGITFIASGTFSSTGVQSILLQGSGTPVNAGAIAVPITAGTTNCSFTVNVVAGNINLSDTAWRFTQGTTTYSGTLDSVVFSKINGIDVLQFYGFTSPNGDSAIVIGLAMTSATIQSGTYNTTAFAGFGFGNAITSAVIYQANFQTLVPPVNISFVLNFDPVTRIARGTFSGTAHNTTPTAIPITNGRFTAVVP